MNIKEINNVREHKAIRVWDVLVLLVFLAVLISLFVVIFMPKGDYVEVYEDGKLLFSHKMTDYGKYDVHGKLTVVIDEKGVMVEHSNCPDKLCERQGHIHTNGASIVCLPNKITIVIKGDSEGVDVVS